MKRKIFRIFCVFRVQKTQRLSVLAFKNINLLVIYFLNKNERKLHVLMSL